MKQTLIQNKIRQQLNKGNAITSEMIAELIKDHADMSKRTLGLYERYCVEEHAVPIFNREFTDSGNKINNKMNNDFFKEIIDTKLGYIIGKPVVYNIDKNAYESDEKYKEHYGIISKIALKNNFTDIDAELVKLVSICGHAGREIFVDVNGDIRVMNLKAWETIFLVSPLGEVEYALRYYKDFNDDGEEITRVEFFNDSSVIYFEGAEDAYTMVEEKDHLFGTCPIVLAVNNEECLGDCDNIIPLIDAYDRTLSDISSEIEQFRLAYMYFKGQEPTAEVIESAKQTGGFYVGENGEVGFITKQINDTIVENHLNRLETNILRFGKSVNFTGDDFSGTITGVGMEHKLSALEQKSSVMVTKLTTALRNQFRIIGNVLNLSNIDLDYLDVFFEFKRNIPINKQAEMQANALMVGLVSERTRLSNLSSIGVDDAEYELELMKKEKEELMDSYIGYGTNTNINPEDNLGIENE